MKARKIFPRVPDKSQELEIPESPFSDDERISAAAQMGFVGIDTLLRFASHGNHDAEVALRGLESKLQNVARFLSAKRQSESVLRKPSRAPREADLETPSVETLQAWFDLPSKPPDAEAPTAAS